MLKSAPGETYTSLQTTLTIPGATVETPPPVEGRVYYVPPVAEAYTKPADERGRSVTEVAQACLPDAAELPLLPDSENQSISRLRRKFGTQALKYIVKTLADPEPNPMALYKAVEVLPRIPEPDKKRELALSFINESRVNDHNRRVVSSIIPEISEVDAAGSTSEAAAGLDPKRVAKIGNRGQAKVTPPSRLFKAAQTLQVRLNPASMTQSPLHSRAGGSVKRFGKTGTETYILPKNFEASVRVVPLGAAAAWLSAFENWPEWYRRGFNYVPIEPIQSIAETDDSEMVAVTTTNLRGKSLFRVAEHMPEYKDQLYEMREQIRSGLTDMCIQHSHLHDSNFVVVPYAHENGRPDLTRCPRLYAIDFDQAETIR